jgi:hypothetical protein
MNAVLVGGKQQQVGVAFDLATKLCITRSADARGLFASDAAIGVATRIAPNPSAKKG